MNSVTKTTTRTIFFALILGLAVALGACSTSSDATKADDETAGDEHAGEAHTDEHAGDEHAGDEHAGDEHAGDEHAGDEHAGDEHAGDEHAGDEHAGEKMFSAADIKTAMKSHIEAKTAEGEPGVFTIQDEKAGEELQLEFVKIHEPVRKIEGKGYFACTDFNVKGEADKLYDLDFWLNPKDGELMVTETKIHKHPVKKDGEWVKKARYTFQDDEPVVVE